MDQAQFDALKKQAMINIINGQINQTSFRLGRPLSPDNYQFDLNHKIENNPQQKIKIITTDNSPLPIQSVAFGFASTSLAKALHFLFEHRDIVSVNLPCNLQLEFDPQQPITREVNLYDVQCVVSVQTLEIQSASGNVTVNDVPVAMVSFQLNTGEAYYIDVELPSILSAIAKL